jgi:hypothetical protein
MLCCYHYTAGSGRLSRAMAAERRGVCVFWKPPWVRLRDRPRVPREKLVGTSGVRFPAPRPPTAMRRRPLNDWREAAARPGGFRAGFHVGIRPPGRWPAAVARGRMVRPPSTNREGSAARYPARGGCAGALVAGSLEDRVSGDWLIGSTPRPLPLDPPVGVGSVSSNSWVRTVPASATVA